MTIIKSKELRVTRGSKTKKASKPTKALPTLQRNGLVLVFCKEQYNILGGQFRELYPGDRWNFKLCSVEVFSEVESIIKREIAGYCNTQMQYFHMICIGQDPENILHSAVWQLDEAEHDAISFNLKDLSNMMPRGTRKRVAYLGNARAFMKDARGFDPALLTSGIPSMEMIAYKNDPETFVRTFREERVGPYGLVDQAVLQKLVRSLKDDNDPGNMRWSCTDRNGRLFRRPDPT